MSAAARRATSIATRFVRTFAPTANRSIVVRPIPSVPSSFVGAVPQLYGRSLSFWGAKPAAEENDAKSSAKASSSAESNTERATDGTATQTESANGKAASGSEANGGGTKNGVPTDNASAAAANGSARTASATAAPKNEAKKEEKSANEIALAKEVAALHDKLKAKDILISEMNDRIRAALEEQESVRKRAAAAVENAKKFGIQGFAKSLLEVADTLAMAAASVEKEVKAGHADTAVSESAAFQTLIKLYEGVLLTDKVLQKSFERNKLIKFDPLGEKFDPNLHDGIFQFEDASKTPGSVGAVMKVGYMLGERVLRPATVGTIKGTYPAQPTNNANSNDTEAK